MKAYDIAKALDPKGVKQSGDNFLCRCPAHDDRKASLSIRDGDKGEPVWKCFAGCDFQAIASELKRRGIESRAGNDNASAPTYRTKKRGPIASYNYRDPLTGDTTLVVERYEGKDFRQKRPNPDREGNWIWSVPAAHRTLYRAYEALRCEDVIYFVEGEKDVESLVALGFAATCMPGGANAKWLPQYDAILKGKQVVLLPDNDSPGETYAETVAKGLEGVAASVHVLRLPDLPPKGDVTDWITAGGTADALRSATADAQAWAPILASVTMDVEDVLASEAQRVELDTGSEVEIAFALQTLLNRYLGRVVHAEGEFWRYNDKQWEPIELNKLWRGVQRFDGTLLASGRSRLKLGTKKIGSVLHELQMLCADNLFFETSVQGINCANGFIRFDGAGNRRIEPHSPEHRARHTLPARWSSESSGAIPEGSLLHRLLAGSFQGDEDAAQKIDLLGEAAGVAALGYSTSLREPKALVLYGMTAENGKSQILDVMRSLLPASAVCAISAAKMTDEKHIVGLAGKLLNAADELSGEAIASDTFKVTVTGEQVNGRDVYKSRIEFRPRALHLFATNVLPPYKGGMDRGVQRRLLVLTFSRTVPKDERIERIGQRIGAEEADLLLAWAVEGASRVIRNRGYTEPLSSKSALRDWISKADPVQAWIEDCIEPIEGHWVATSVLYQDFCNWAVAEGYNRDRLPYVNTFTERVQTTVSGVTPRRRTGKRGLIGLRVKAL